LRQAVDLEIVGFKERLIKKSASPSRVYRVALAYPPGHSSVPSVIVKTISPHWPDDPHGPDREPKFYAQVLPRLELKQPRIYHVGMNPETGHRLIVMEDLAETYRFPEPSHCWTAEESRYILRAYARLHVQGRAYLLPADEHTWMWRMELEKRPWGAGELLNLIDSLVAKGIWMPVPGIDCLVERTLADIASFAGEPATLLHNDVYPPNIALPNDPEAEAILLDWEMVGWGLAELDIAFLFLQPFRSAASLDRAKVLEYYWSQRWALEGTCPSAAEREARFHHAEAVWALSLVPVAHRVAISPYPSGSAPRVYWDSMFGVLKERLRELSTQSLKQAPRH
jgi:hypothetical protein